MPTTILYNGPIYTLDPALPKAQALAVRDGRVLAVGSEGKVTAAAGGRAEGINLRGRAVIPALTDAHVHLVAHALRRREVNLDGVSDFDAALRQIAQAAEALPPGEWLRGGGWDHVRWGGHWPAAAALDAITPDRPALLLRKDGHCGWANSRALALAGIDAATPDPAGGSIRRDNGQATGLLFENAIDMVRQLIPAPTSADRLDAVRDAIAEAHSYGMVGMHIPPNLDPGDGALTLQIVQQLCEQGQLGLRCLVHLDLGTLDEAIGLGLRSGLGDRWIRLGAVKLFADGTLGSETAEMLQHYEGKRSSGMQTIATGELNERVRSANSNGIAVIIHAIGDGANRRVLDAIAQTRSQEPRTENLGGGPGSLAPRVSHIPNRIEHCQLVHPDDIPRFAQLGVVASMQPTHCTADIEIAEKLWGERCATAYAWKALQQAGAVLAFGSDAPVESLNPWYGIHAAVTRRRRDGTPAGGWHTEQCLSLDDALHGFTTGAACAAGADHEQGMLRPGMLADLAVLNANPFALPADDLHRVAADMTMVEGEIVWERN